MITRGSHQWNTRFHWLLWCLCTLERSQTLFLALWFWTYSNLQWLPLHLGHSCHPGILLHGPLTVFFTFFFVGYLILLALPPLIEHILQDLFWEGMWWVDIWRFNLTENTFILPWLVNRILGWKYFFFPSELWRPWSLDLAYSITLKKTKALLILL